MWVSVKEPNRKKEKERESVTIGTGYRHRTPPTSCDERWERNDEWFGCLVLHLSSFFFIGQHARPNWLTQCKRIFEVFFSQKKFYFLIFSTTGKTVSRQTRPLTVGYVKIMSQWVRVGVQRVINFFVMCGAQAFFFTTPRALTYTTPTTRVYMDDVNLKIPEK